jgi:hypothetical protein
MACAAPSNEQTSYFRAQWSFDDMFSFPFIFSLQPWKICYPCKKLEDCVIC